jgi:hypothetical protein
MKLILTLSYVHFTISNLRILSPETGLKTTYMNWETVTSELGHKVYALWNNGRKLLTFASTSSPNFVRLECEGEKRMFQIRYEGFLKNKMVMRNEYGVRIGQIRTENKETFIELNDRKYFFSLNNDNSKFVSIYDGTHEQPVAVCDLGASAENGILKSIKENANPHSLLLALCWYLFVSVTGNVSNEVV